MKERAEAFSARVSLRVILGHGPAGFGGLVVERVAVARLHRAPVDERLQGAIHRPAREASLLDDLVHPAAAVKEHGPPDRIDLLVEARPRRPYLAHLVERAREHIR